MQQPEEQGAKRRWRIQSGLRGLVRALAELLVTVRTSKTPSSSELLATTSDSESCIIPL